MSTSRVAQSCYVTPLQPRSLVENLDSSLTRAVASVPLSSQRDSCSACSGPRALARLLVPRGSSVWLLCLSWAVHTCGMTWRDRRVIDTFLCLQACRPLPQAPPLPSYWCPALSLGSPTQPGLFLRSDIEMLEWKLRPHVLLRSTKEGQE